MKTNPLLEHHYSREEVARLVGVCKETIKRAQRRGELEAVKFNSRLIRYAESEVTRWLEAGRTRR